MEILVHFSQRSAYLNQRSIEIVTPHDSFIISPCFNHTFLAFLKFTLFFYFCCSIFQTVKRYMSSSSILRASTNSTRPCQKTSQKSRSRKQRKFSDPGNVPRFKLSQSLSHVNFEGGSSRTAQSHSQYSSTSVASKYESKSDTSSSSWISASTIRSSNLPQKNRTWRIPKDSQYSQNKKKSESWLLLLWMDMIMWTSLLFVCYILLLRKWQRPVRTNAHLFKYCIWPKYVKNCIFF